MRCYSQLIEAMNSEALKAASQEVIEDHVTF